MNAGELTPFVMYFGLASIIAMILGFPIWFYLKMESLRRSIRYLREDIEMQQTELEELRKQIQEEPETDDGIMEEL